MIAKYEWISKWISICVFVTGQIGYGLVSKPSEKRMVNGDC